MATRKGIRDTRYQSGTSCTLGAPTGKCLLHVQNMNLENTTARSAATYTTPTHKTHTTAIAAGQLTPSVTPDDGSSDDFEDAAATDAAASRRGTEARLANAGAAQPRQPTAKSPCRFTIRGSRHLFSIHEVYVIRNTLYLLFFILF